MRIAMMVRGYIPVPRPADIVYSIIDLAQTIAEELASRGHSVDFYAPDGSKIRLPAKVRTLQLRPLARKRQELNDLINTSDLLTGYMPSLWDHRLAGEMFCRAAAGEYDILHFHHPEGAISLAPLFPGVQVVYTVHDSLHKWHSEIFQMFQSPNQHYISISDRQRANAPGLPYVATIYDGVDIDEFGFSPIHDNYLLYVGRIVPDKGVAEAVQIARRTGERLLIIGPVLPENQQYFDKRIKPYLSDKIEYLGHKKHEETIPYFQNAKCMLMPLKWEEPFGVTMIESMASGTPVIALRRGSVPEVIADGKTGFICETIDEMVEAVGKIHQIDRLECRRRVEHMFTIHNMVDGYERTFQKIIRKAMTVPAKPIKKVREFRRLPSQFRRKSKHR